MMTLLAAPGALRAQEQPDPVTLLPQPTLDRIADAVSGAQAMRHVLELGAYEGKRDVAEYRGTYFETEYVKKMAAQYGLSDVQVHRYPAPPQWHAKRGELWLVTPGQRRLLISHRDVPAALVPGSASADETAELVFVGLGAQDADYAGRDVRGKILLTTGPIAPVVREGVEKRGARGIISTHNALGKTIDRPGLVSWTRLPQPAQGPQTFAFALSHRIGQEVLGLVERGPVTVRAVVETEVFPDVEHEVTVATIPGDGSTNEEVVFVAHLFEGVTKQGAGDNIAGSATILEVARAYRALMAEGVLPQPRRTLRFVWAPEFAGTIPWVQANGDLVPRMLTALNMDMVGADLTAHKGNLKLYRNPTSLPSFVSDVAQQFFEYVGETNREKVHNRGIAYAFTRPIVDPSGTQDPFFYHVEKYYGSSDHAVFMGAGVPMIFFNHWPDAVYHTSEDRPNALDPTQLKRAAFLGVSIAAVLADAGAEDAARLATLSSGYASQRTAEALTSALAQMTAAKPAELAVAYAEARNSVEQAYQVERAAIRSVERVARGNRRAGEIARTTADQFYRGREGDLARLRSAYMLLAEAGGARVSEPARSAAERAAARVFPTTKQTSHARRTSAPSSHLRGFHAMEALLFADGTRSVLDIRNAISAELGPVSVESVQAFFDELAGQNLVEIRRS
jgi:hypothetical protein